MAELVAYAKANPGKLNYGSSGAGGLTHYSVELFEARTGTHMVHIPFQGGAPARPRCSWPATLTSRSPT